MIISDKSIILTYHNYNGFVSFIISYRKILVAINASKTSFFAADYAIDLAQKYKAQLIILHVLH
ncbi:MAG: hypothetical protein E6K94_05900 [Thaumarchaeota archaeon]|nr:MAG: hypothetical protein E6K94_05900 [Nitrososphaerota archaeon]